MPLTHYVRRLLFQTWAPHTALLGLLNGHNLPLTLTLLSQAELAQLFPPPLLNKNHSNKKYYLQSQVPIQMVGICDLTFHYIQKIKGINVATTQTAATGELKWHQELTNYLQKQNKAIEKKMLHLVLNSQLTIHIGMEVPSEYRL